MNSSQPRRAVREDPDAGTWTRMFSMHEEAEPATKRTANSTSVCKPYLASKETQTKLV